MKSISKPPLAEMVKKRVFRTVLLPTFIVYITLAGLLIISHIWILQSQMTHKAHIASITADEFISNSKSILRVYADKIKSDSGKINPQEHFLLTRYFHDISLLDSRQHTVIKSTILESGEQIAQPLFYELPSEIPYQYEKLTSPYYSVIARTTVMGLLGRYNPDYVVVGEVNLSRLWSFIKASISSSDLLFITDRFGNYVADSNVVKVLRQENISHYDWFPRETSGNFYIFRIGAFEGSWFLVAGVYNPVSHLWTFVLTPISAAFSPTFYMLGFMLCFAFVSMLLLRWLVLRWLDDVLVTPLTSFASYVRNRFENKILPVSSQGFFPFKEGKILENVFEESMEKLLDDERAIQETAEKFQIITDTAPMGIFVFQDDRIVYVNEEGCRITGYSQEEFQDIVPFWQIVGEEYRDIVAYNATRRQEGLIAEQVTYELPIKTKSGERRIIRATVSTTTLKNRPAGIITAMDISEIKQAEEEKRKLEMQLQRYQRIESLGTLVAGISHEFNNILHAIALNIEHLGMELQKLGIANDRMLKHIEDVGVLQQRAANIIRELLVFSRGEGLEKTKLLLREEIERVVMFCKHVFPRSIEIRTEFQEKGASILAGKGQVEQIFLNLLNNARDAIESRDGVGVIEIKTELLSEQSDSYVKITVRDNGIGMPKEVLERIFEPFFTTKPIGKGSGLGLSMVYGIVKQLNGDITCESEWGKGTTFTLILPAMEFSEPERIGVPVVDLPEDEKNPAITPRKKRILIVEDEITIRNLMSEFLSKEGYMVEQASTAEEALRLLDGTTYDLVITDLGLPGMGGEKFLEELTRRKTGIPIIIASGYMHGKKVLENPGPYGVVASLSKPFSVGKLKETVEKVLNIG